MTVVISVVAIVVFVLAIGEVIWRMWDWPARDPGWWGAGRLTAMVLIAVLTLLMLDADPGRPRFRGCQARPGPPLRAAPLGRPQRV